MATEHDSSDTEQAPTEQASAETTELPPAKAAEVVQAWSIDDPAEVDSDSPRRGWLLSVGLVGLVVVVAGALIFLAATFFSSHRSKPVEPKAQPTTTVPVAAPPPPAVTVITTPRPTVTVTAEPPAPPPLSATDQQFLAALRTYGLTYPDPEYAISHAHATCDFMASHSEFSLSSPTGNYIARTTIWPDNGPAAIFAYQSATTYCPQHQSD
jgi:heme/copper-type cytochrome/quinol oxidase subunit 2